ncbi:MAG: tandem-95 repeat protein [Pirellulaceae bacterium]
MADNTVIQFSGAENQDQMALLISNAIAQAGLGLAPQYLGNGIIELNAQPNHTIDLSGSSMTRADRIGLVTDGDTFRIDDGAQVVTFEFENITLANGVNGANTAINYLPGDPVDAVADAMVAALATSNLGLTPINRGAGRVELGDTVRHLVSVTNSNLVKSGVPGGAVPIVIRSNATGNEVARSIVRAINLADATLGPMGIAGAMRGGSTLFVNIDDALGQPADFVSGFATVAGIDNFFLPAVKDLPGNSLKANQSTDETTFTILLPGVQLDYGDVPDPFAGTGRYPTLLANDGARHVITSSPLYLGTGIDGDADGQPTRVADGDDADHLLDIAGSNLDLFGLPPFSIQVPAGGGADIEDEETLTIVRNGVETTLEFDSGGGVTAPNIAIPYSPTDTTDEIAARIVDRINRNRGELTLSAPNLGGGLVFLGGDPGLTIDINNANLTNVGGARVLLNVPSGGGAVLNDGDTLTVTQRGADRQTVTRVTFELDSNGSVAAGNEPVTFALGASAEEVADAIVAAMTTAMPQLANVEHLGNGIVSVQDDLPFSVDGSGNGISVTAAPVVQLQLPIQMQIQVSEAGGAVIGDGETITLDDGNDGTIFEWDSGFNVEISPTLALQVPVAGASAISDGETFTINDGTGIVTFEFDLNGVVTPGNRPIRISPQDTADRVARSVVLALLTAHRDIPGAVPQPARLASRLLARDLGGGSVHVGATGDHRVEVSSSSLASNITQYPLTLEVPQRGGQDIADDEIFSVSDGSKTVEFELDRDNSGPTAPNRFVISFSGAESTESIAEKIVGALKASNLGLRPLHVGNGIISLGGNARHTVDTALTSLERSVFVGGMREGERFTVSDGTASVTFEIDTDGRFLDIDGDFTPDNTLIRIGASDTHEQIAGKIVTALRDADLGLAPVHVGDGKINVGGTTAHDLNTSRSPSLTVTSRPGVQLSTTLQLPGEPAIQVPTNGGAGIADGESFVIVDARRVIAFEFNLNAAFEDANRDGVPDNVLIPFTGLETRDALADLLVTALANSGLNLNPADLGGGLIGLTGLAGRTLDLTSTSLERADRSSIADGETFSITNGQQTVFEFDNDGAFIDADNDTNPDNLLVDITDHIQIQVVGPSFDGELFTITDGTATWTFELDQNGLTAGINIPVPVGTNSIDEIAASITNAINNTGVGVPAENLGGGTVRLVRPTPAHAINTGPAPSLQARAMPLSVSEVSESLIAAIDPSGADVAPVDLGDGRIQLLDTPRHVTDVSGSSLTTTGVPGGAVAVQVRADDSPAAVGRALTEALAVTIPSLAPVHDGQGGIDLSGVTANQRLDTSAVTGVAHRGSVSDGETFVISDGIHPSKTFEFDVNGDGVAAGHVLISSPQTRSANQVVDAVVTAVQGELDTRALAGLDPQNAGNGRIHLANRLNDQLFLSPGSLLEHAGRVPVVLQTADAGLVLQIPPRIELTILPGAGGSGNSLADGDKFIVRDGVNEVLFEFDLGGGRSPNSEPIALDVDDSVESMANAVVTAINQVVAQGRLLPLAPVHLGGGVVDLGASANHGFKVVDQNGLEVTIPGLRQAGPIQDGDTFSIEDGVHAKRTFEFDSGGSVSGTNEAVRFNASDSAATLASLIARALTRAASDAGLDAIEGALDGVSAVNIGNAVVDVVTTSAGDLTIDVSGLSRVMSTGNVHGIGDGQTLTIDDGKQSVTFEFDRNGKTQTGNRIINIADYLKIQVPAAGAAAGGISDGDTFSVEDRTTGQTIVYEFDSDGQVADDDGDGVPDNVVLNIRDHFLLQVPPAGGNEASNGIADGDSFVIDDGSTATVFEFDKDGLFADANTDAIPDNALINVRDHLVISVAGVVADGDTFQIANRTDAFTFEFNEVNGFVTPGRFPVAISTTPQGIAADMVAAINGSPVELHAVAMEINSIWSVVLQHPKADDSLDLSGTGTLDPGTLPVNQAELASLIATAVAQSPVGMDAEVASGGAAVRLRNPSQSDRVTVRGGPDLTVAAEPLNQDDVAEVITAAFDAAGLGLTPENQGNGVVLLADTTPSHRLHLEGTPTLSREIVGRDASEIARAITRAIDASGLSVEAANLGGGAAVQLQVDDEDGVSFDGVLTPVVPGDPARANLSTPITVTASADGFLDAWFDWNQDGDWDDPAEFVFQSVKLVAGPNQLNVTVPARFPAPSSLPLGDTYARFRFSSQGKLLPTGLAVDGEVEDYRVRIVSNEGPIVVGAGIPDRRVLEDANDDLINVALRFDDVDVHNGNGDQLTFEVVDNSNPTLVAASLNPDGKILQLDYRKDQNGFASVTIRATDQGGLSVEHSFVIRVDAVNDEPAAHPQRVTTTEDTPVAITLTGDDGDPLPNENQTLTYFIRSLPANGTLFDGNLEITSITPDPHELISQLSYVPGQNYNGMDSFEFGLIDDNTAGGPALASFSATVSLIVAPTNDAPTAADLDLAMEERPTGAAQTPRDIDLASAVDAGAPNESAQTLTTTIRTYPTGGTLLGVDTQTGVVTGPLQYLPDADFNGTDSFTYFATDDGRAGEPADLTSNVATVTLSITPVNAPPVVPDPQSNPQIVPAIEDTPVVITLVADDGDPEVDQVLVLAHDGNPLDTDGFTTGTLSAIDPANQQVTYTPPTDFTGQVTFTYQVVQDDDQAGDPANLPSGTATVTIQVQAVNDPPTALAPEDETPPRPRLTVAEDDVNGLLFTLSGLDGDAEFDQELDFSIDTSNTDGTLAFDGREDNLTVRYRYNPALNFNGEDTFVFTVTDDGLPNETSSPTTVTIDVTPVNDAPVADSDNVTVQEDVPQVITLTGFDVEAQDLTFVVNDPAPGTFEKDLFGEIIVTKIGSDQAQVTYTSDADFNGNDRFTFQVNDGDKSSGLATMNVLVNAVNDAPIFSIPGGNRDVTVLEDSGLQIRTGWATGVLPGPETARDERNSQTVTFEVERVNTTNPGLFDGDVEVVSSGALSFRPASQQNGQAVFTVRAVDSGQAQDAQHPLDRNVSARETFTITVAAVNDPPQFNSISTVRPINEDDGPAAVQNWATGILPGPVGANDEVAQNLHFEVTYQELGNLSFATGGEPALTIRELGNGNKVADLSYTVAPNANGSAVVAVTLVDDGGGDPAEVAESLPRTFTINVNPINDAPEFGLTDGSTDGRVDANGNVAVDEDAGWVTITDFAVDMKAGPAGADDEDSQAMFFSVLPGAGVSFTQLPEIDEEGTLTFQTAPDKHGVVVVQVQLSDDGSGMVPHQNRSAVQTFTLTVSSVNDPPEFVTGADQDISEDGGPQIVLGWATNIRPGPISATDEASQTIQFIVSAEDPSLFTAGDQPAISPSGTLTYTPAPDAFGSSSVTVTAQDSGGATRTETFGISIRPVNDAPQLTVPTVQTTTEDMPLPIPPISISDVDNAHGPFDVQVTLRVEHGTLSLNTSVPGGVTDAGVSGNGTGTVIVSATIDAINTTLASKLPAPDETPNGLIYQGAPDFNTLGNREELTITVDDLGNIGAPGKLTVQKNVRITVTPVNDPPFVANPVADIEVDEDSSPILVELVPDVFDDPDIETNNQTLSLRVINNSNPQLVVDAINGTVLSLRLAADMFGEADITIEASDGSEAVQDTFKLIVAAVNDAPGTQPDFFVVPGDRSTVVNVLSNDEDIDSNLVPSSVAIISAPNNANLVVTADGSVTVTPARGFRGVTSFTYSVQDEEGAESIPTTATIEVNDPPLARDDTATTRQGDPVTVDVLANDTDSDGTLDPASVVVTRTPTGGTAAVDPQTGVITYTPFSSFDGQDSFEYTVQDDDGGVSDPATVSVTVIPVRHWQNPADGLRMDVNADGRVSAIDVLQVINKLNTGGPGVLPDPTPGNQPPPFYDVNGDGLITPIDALEVINFLNESLDGEGEGSIVSGYADASEDLGQTAVVVAPGFAEYVMPSQSPLVNELRQGRSETRAVRDGHDPIGISHFLADSVMNAMESGPLSPAAEPLEEALDALLAGGDPEQSNADATDLLFAGTIENDQVGYRVP